MPSRGGGGTTTSTSPTGFCARWLTSFPVANPNDLLGAYLEVNRNLRRANHELFQKISSHSNPQPLWSGAFRRFSGKPMARFGDRRTYLYQNKAVDQQTHLGEDLASLVNSPVYAGNNGVVVYAEPLGIYGQTVILDHGLGVFSSYSHLSQIDVKVGDKVDKGAVLGRTGTTGLAAGDHLHFAINLQGEFVDPLEWWDPHWLKDQVEGVWARGRDCGRRGRRIETGQGARKRPPRPKARPPKAKRRETEDRTPRAPRPPGEDTPSLPGVLGPCWLGSPGGTRPWSPGSGGRPCSGSRRFAACISSARV